MVEVKKETKAPAAKVAPAKAVPVTKAASVAAKPSVAVSVPQKKSSTEAKETAAIAVVKDKKSAKTGISNRLYLDYKKRVIPALMKNNGFKNVNAVPRIDKVVINISLGDVKDNTKSFQGAVDEIAMITGQKPLITKAKKSISNFKLREGQKIGAKVTLRGQRMYEFLDKLISIALPRVRDFRGISPKSFDSFGNYALGIKEQLVFPEISYEKIEKVRGFDVCIVTTAKNTADSLVLLTEMGFPFRAK